MLTGDLFFMTLFQAATVTSVCPSQNPLRIITLCDRLDPGGQTSSCGEHPIWKSPGGTQTYDKPSSGFVLVHTVPDPDALLALKYDTVEIIKEATE
jgi:hypothetical protein